MRTKKVKTVEVHRRKGEMCYINGIGGWRYQNSLDAENCRCLAAALIKAASEMEKEK